jgi:hypothetical protein
VFIKSECLKPLGVQCTGLAVYPLLIQPITRICCEYHHNVNDAYDAYEHPYSKNDEVGQRSLEV